MYKYVGEEVRTFECSADDGTWDQNDTLYDGSTLAVKISYVAFGLVHMHHYTAKKVSSVKKPSRVFSMAENADKYLRDEGQFAWAFNNNEIVGRSNRNQRVSYNRHGDQANYLYVDGHVESMSGNSALALPTNAAEFNK